MKYVIGRRDLGLSVVAIAALAVAQPILDLLGRNPEFFLARAAPSVDVILLAIVVAVVLPVLLAGVVLAVHAVHAPTGRIFHAGIFTALGAVLILTALKRLRILERFGWWLIVFAVATAIGVTLLHRHSATLRGVFRFLSAAPVVVAGFFLFIAPTSQLAWALDSSTEPFTARVGNPAPVVMVVFDEFPIASIIDREGNIQAEHFPSFARLAAEGTWFRNAVGLHQKTEEALPTILSGVLAPLEGKVPSASDHPYTVFSLLGSYDVNAIETVTELCPDTVCEGRSRQVRAFGPRWRTLASDLIVVSGHLFLPDSLSDWFPAIDQTWGDFGGVEFGKEKGWGMRHRVGELLADDRRTEVIRFLDLVDKPLGEGEFYFSHMMIPHWPWIHMPDGRLYAENGSTPAYGRDGWSSNKWLVEQGYQRHLLQVQYADTIVGQILERLDAHGSYEDTMIILLADHGGTARPNVAHRRGVWPETIGDVAAIPLFVKQPHHERPGIDDYRAEIIDVLPTIADVLQVDVPWSVDGVSLFADERPRRTESTMMASAGSVTFGITGSEKLEVANYHLDYFDDRGPFGIAPKGYADLLGEEVAGLSADDHPSSRVVLDNPEWYSDLEVDADFIPALLTGAVVGDIDGDAVLAVAINGRIEALTRTWVQGERTRFQAIIPPDAFIDGSNDMSILVVGGAEEERRLTNLSLSGRRGERVPSTPSRARSFLSAHTSSRSNLPNYSAG